MINHPTEIGLNNLQPGDRVSAMHPDEPRWCEVELVAREAVPTLVDMAIGPVWIVRDAEGREWQSTGEMMETL